MRSSPLDLIMGWTIFLLLLAFAKLSLQQECEIMKPVNSTEIYQVYENDAIHQLIFEVLFKPEDAVMRVQSVGGPGSLVSWYEHKFAFDISTPGVLQFFSNDSLALPPYPSIHTQAFLPIRLMCNSHPYSVGTIHISNINDNAPQFYNEPYVINLSELVGLNATIPLPILAIDWDPAPEYRVTFQIASGDEDKYFGLEKAEGIIRSQAEIPISNVEGPNWSAYQLPHVVQLRVLKHLDFDLGKRVFFLNISATDNARPDASGTFRSNYTMLQVNLVDEDDLPPQFQRNYYNSNISLKAPAGTYLRMDEEIRARDGDELGAPLSFRLLPDTWTKYFSANASSGAIYLNQPLPDSLATFTFDLVLEAVQTDNEKMNSITYVHVTVLPPEGGSVPHFLDCKYFARISENPVPGAQVLKLSATTPISGVEVPFRFALLNSSDAINFVLNPESGVLSVGPDAVLDRESKPIHLLQATVLPFASNAASSTVRSAADEEDTPFGLVQERVCVQADITVELLDENDNGPVFDSPLYQFYVPDTIENLDLVGIVSATDPDDGINGEVEYVAIEQDQLAEDVSFVGFPILNGSFEIKIRLPEGGRANFRSKYTIAVEAKDKAPEVPRTSRAKVEVFVAFTNAHLPVFESAKYDVSIPENLREGSQILKVAATDPDEGLSGEFDYYLMEDGLGAFSIDPQLGWITVRNSSILDRERVEIIDLQVGTRPRINETAQADPGLGPHTAIVSILLNDENDNAPVFMGVTENTTLPEYLFSLTSDIEIAQFIGRVVVEDADSGPGGQVELSPISVPIYFNFLDDGAITLALPFPPNPDPEYTIVVEARDLPEDLSEQKKSVATVKIRVEDVSQAAPRFTNLPKSVSVSEAFPIGSLVFSFAVTESEGPVSFSIASGDPEEQFGVQNQELYVKNLLDAETTDEYLLTVEAWSGNLSSSGELRIQVQDANDNPPKWAQRKYFFVVEERVVKEGQLVGVVTATDADRSAPQNSVSYTLEDTGGGFQIDPLTGTITVATLVNPSLKRHTFSVIATDNGTPQLQDVAFVTVDFVSEFVPPKFTQSQYGVEVQENLGAKAIALVGATHPSGPVQYSLSAETDNSLFAIDASGKVSTLAGLDFETASVYRLEVFACIRVAEAGNGGELCSSVLLIVTVTDANDNSPIFEKELYESNAALETEMGTEVVRTVAIDKDSGPFGDLTYALRTPSAVFAIDYDTGAVIVSGELRVPQRHELVVEAFDHGMPKRKGTTRVVIHVNGTNPSAPTFGKFAYEAVLAEDIPIGSSILDLEASDPDEGADGEIFYRFANDPQTLEAAGKFSLNASSGTLKTAAGLDFEEHELFQMVVEAVDRSPIYARSGATVVTVRVKDVNDERPTFQPLPTTVFISTTKKRGSEIISVYATDRDGGEGGNNRIVYGLQPADHEFFQLEENRILVRKQLEEGEFQLRITATDQGTPPLNSSHPMTVVVMAGREKYPVFPQLAYDLLLNINDTFPKTFPGFSAKVQSGSIAYRLLDAPQSIAIDPQSGTISVQQSLLGEVKQNQQNFFIIRATNVADTRFVSDVVVRYLLSYNKGTRIPLLFSSALYRTTIPENVKAGTFLNLTISPLESASFNKNSFQLRYWTVPDNVISVDDHGRAYVVQDLDLESTSSVSPEGIYKVKVFVTNETSSTSTVLEVKIRDINEFPPIFQKPLYRVRVKENIRDGDNIVKVTAIDRDFMPGLQYRIKDGGDMFQITREGVIYKKGPLLLDRETIPELKIVVEAVDVGGNTAETMVLIELEDVNDNPPDFFGLPYEWKIPEGPGGLDAKFLLSGFDLDSGVNGEIAFSILQGNQHGLFLLQKINETQAEISVIRELDRETNSHRILTIEARDKGEPTLFRITNVLFPPNIEHIKLDKQTFI